MLHKKMLQAKKRYEATRNAISRAVRKHYPVGSKVRVELGRAVVDGIVETHGVEWCEPEMVGIRNIATGKRRRFNALYDEARLLRRGPAKE